jgi:MFS family permease
VSAANVPALAGFLERERIVARPGFNRWLVPPAARAIHLCIGMAYGFSVFWLPLSKAIGITKPVACPATAGLLDYLTTTSCDWKVALLQSWIYGLFFVFLGSSAALWGGWLERVGPRKAGIVAAFCWCGGILVMAFGVARHQLWIVWRGGPDVRRRDRSTAGAGGNLFRLHDGWCARLPRAAGELETCKLESRERQQAVDHGSPGPPQRRLAHTAVLAAVERPDAERLGRHRDPEHGFPAAAGGVRRPPDRRDCGLRSAHTRAAREHRRHRRRLHRTAVALQHPGAHFLGSLSDRLGILLYSSIPWTAAAGSLALFVLFCCIILSMYGGGFATIPAYLSDLVGTKMVGAIHGRLLTAWSTAGVLGPLLIGYLRQYQLDHGVPKAQVYSFTMYIFAALLALGFLCNLLVRPVPAKNYMTSAQLAQLDAEQHLSTRPAAAAVAGDATPSRGWLVAAAWLAVGVPIAWGVWITLHKAVILFGL